MRYIACASRAYAEAQGLPQTFEALRAAPVITSGVVGKQLRLRGYQGELRQEVMLEPTIISEHFPFLRQGILAGLGVGLVPDYVVQDAVTSGEVLTTLDEWRLSILARRCSCSTCPTGTRRARCAPASTTCWGAHCPRRRDSDSHTKIASALDK